jgi:SRSO17 transposase
LAAQIAIAALGLTYIAGIRPNATVWAPGLAPLRPKTWSGRERPPKLIRRDRNHWPISVKALALGLPAKAWRTIAWRESHPEGQRCRSNRGRSVQPKHGYALQATIPKPDRAGVLQAQSALA